jgi:hypothetical protein
MGFSEMTDSEKTVTVEVKPKYKSKTIWVALLLILAGGLDRLLGSEVLGSELADYAQMLSGVVMIVLRKLTVQPIA